MSVVHINERNVNQAFCEALWKLKTLDPETSPSRNGDVLMFPYPVITEIRNPQERVLFWGLRDANPYFHLMESLWMLAGRNDVDFPAHFVKSFVNYSDDGIILDGAYGYRWRNFFDFDQLEKAAEMLKTVPETRRVVIQMWDAFQDLGSSSVDIPCNLSIVVDTRGGRLNFYISNRSNDIVWGLYGANAVHFSVLQEFLASYIGIPVGTMYTFSVNAHLYTSPAKNLEMLSAPIHEDKYASGKVEPFPLVSTNIESWQQDLQAFMDDPGQPKIYSDIFFQEVAQPMYLSWEAHKAGMKEKAIRRATMIIASDWREATLAWLNRRYSKQS